MSHSFENIDRAMKELEDSIVKNDKEASLKNLQRVYTLLFLLKARAEVRAEAPLVYDHSHVIWIRTQATDSQIAALLEQRDKLLHLFSKITITLDGFHA